MASVKSTRRPAIDYPSGRGAGLPAAGVHAVDRKLGALPTDFRKQGASGQPSASADSGYSRATIQRVNRGFEAQKSLEDIPEVSWFKQNAERLNAMGLTPRLVLEMYRGLNDHKPRSDYERRLIAEMNRRVIRTRREVRAVTRLALLEATGRSHRPARLDEFDVGSLVSAGIRGIAPLVSGDSEQKLSAQAPTPKGGIDSEQVDAVLKSSEPDLSGDPITRSELKDLAQEENLVSGVLACNTSSLEIFQTFLAVTGVVGDIGTFFGLPVGIAADLVNACINLICGNYFYAMLDLFAVIPFAGDLVKIFYAKRLLKPLGLTDDLAILKSSTDRKQQVEVASRVINTAIDNQTVGPRVSRIFIGLKRTFETAQNMAKRLGGFLARVIDRAIDFLEGVQNTPQSMTSRAMSWIFGELPGKILTVLKKIKSEGIPALKEFIVGLFGTRKAAQATASGAQVRHAMDPGEEKVAEPSAKDDALYEPGPYDDILKGQFGSYITPFDDANSDGIPDDEQPEAMRRFQGGAPRLSPYLKEGAIRKKRKSRAPAKEISLAKAMSGDDSVVDEMSTVAGSLGSSGAPGGGGYIIPMGMRPSGPKRKSLEQLVPGYEFVGGRYPYSR